jgi:hypothetical protein
MRTAPWLCLPLVCLAAGLLASPAFARTLPPRPVVLTAEGKVPTFLGYGLTEQDARDHALKQAREWLADKGGFDWTPPEDYLLRKELVRRISPDPEELKAAQGLKIAGPQEVVKLELVVTAVKAEEIQKVAREARMQERQGLLARIFVGLVALLLVAGGYLHLEEKTRGYCTTLLRAAAVTVLALVGAGLWLLA